jgi:hypothetical protein
LLPSTAEVAAINTVEHVISPIPQVPEELSDESAMFPEDPSKHFDLFCH